MSKWIKITGRYDHAWPSHAVTSYSPGVYLLPDELAALAIAAGQGEIVSRPEAKAAQRALKAARQDAHGVAAAAAAVGATAANEASAAANSRAKPH
jgi:hypothetical protein